GYGIGTRLNWNECVSWISKAASGGNVTAMIFLNNILSDRSLSSVFSPDVAQSKREQNTRALLGLQDTCRRDPFKIIEILDCLRNTAPETYSQGSTCVDK